ncbi:MAG: hypothetical protein IKU07_08115 [Oscillospiraceae bacterium]|nr:hypothetical protein [Oscillospiraceae bacterium]
MQKNPQGFDPQEIKRLAATAAGQQLMALLSAQDPTAIQSAVAQAAAGNMDSAKNILQPLLSSEDIQKLIKQLGG